MEKKLRKERGRKGGGVWNEWHEFAQVHCNRLARNTVPGNAQVHCNRLHTGVMYQAAQVHFTKLLTGTL